jgi:hypothetical protein
MRSACTAKLCRHRWPPPAKPAATVVATTRLIAACRYGRCELGRVRVDLRDA